MGRLTAEDRKEIERLATTPSGAGTMLGTGMRYLDRAIRLGGLGVGTVAAETPIGQVGRLIPGVQDWLPDMEQLPEAAGEFRKFVSQGDWDAAITAYQDKLDAGWGFWGGAELAGELLIPGGLAKAGTGVISKALPMAQTLGRAVPATMRPAAVRGIETGLRGTGQAMRAPWVAEEAVGRAMIYPFRKAWQAYRGGPTADAALDVADEMTTPEQAMEIDELAGPTPVAGPVRFASTMSSGGTVEAGMRSDSIASVHTSELSPARVQAYNEAFGTNYTPRNIADRASLRSLQASGAQHYHASPVCKNFTKAKTIRTADPNDLAIAQSVARDIREVRPPTVSIENVPAYKNTALFELITKALDNAGYNWDVSIVNAADYGAAQTRTRMIVRAVRKDVGELPSLPETTGRADWYALLKDLIDAEEAIPIAQAMRGKKPGDPNNEIFRIQRYISMGKLDESSPIITMGSSASKDVPAASNAGNVAPTLLATEKAVPRIIIPGAQGLADATVVRVTPRMMNRLMGLPESYALPRDVSLAKNILGDGVHGAITRNFIQPLVDLHRGVQPPTAGRAAPGADPGLPMMRDPDPTPFPTEPWSWITEMFGISKRPQAGVTNITKSDYQAAKAAGISPEILDDMVLTGRSIDDYDEFGNLINPSLIAQRARADRPIKMGKQALLNRMGMDERLGRLNPETRADAVAFLNLLPDQYLEDLAATFRRAQEGLGPGADPESSIAGRYRPGRASWDERRVRRQASIIEISASIANEPGGADVIIHEVMHHLEEFVSWEDVRKLLRRFENDMDNGGADLVSEVNLLRAERARRREYGLPTIPLTDAERVKIRRAYRYTNWQEWFAEVMMEKAVRDIYMEIPVYKNIIEKVMAKIRVIAETAIRWIKELMGLGEDAERVYQKIIRGDYSVAARREIDLFDVDSPVRSDVSQRARGKTGRRGAPATLATEVAPDVDAALRDVGAGAGGPPPGGRGGQGDIDGGFIGPRDPRVIVRDPTASFEEVATLGSWSRKVNAMATYANKALEALGVTWRRRLRTEEIEGVIETAKRVKDKIKAKADSEANLVRTEVRKGMTDNFQIDAKTGHILDAPLQNVARVAHERGELILASPTIQDIAARYDVYEPLLTKGQRDFMEKLREIVETGTTSPVEGGWIKIPGWNQVFRDHIPGWDPLRVRTDITGNGFYISRGSIKTADGKGYSITEELEDLVSLADEQSKRKPIPAEKEARMPAMGKLVDAQGNIISSGDRYALPDKTIQDYIQGVADRVADTNIDARLKELAAAHPGRKWVDPRRAREIKIVQADDALADAINREFGVSFASKLANLPLIRHTNNLYKSLKASMDLSAFGIHGYLGMYGAQKPFVQATSLMFRSLARSMPWSRQGQKVVDDATAQFDTEATEAGRLTSRVWASDGLRQGGTAIETAIPGGEKLMDVSMPIVGPAARGLGAAFQLSNRLFGSFGDMLRLRWADEMLQEEMAKGKTIREMLASGETREIAETANMLTGWSDRRFMGDIGELTMFAARFFQSRLDTYGQALLGATRIRPPTPESFMTLGQTRVNVPFRGKPIIESDVLASMGRAQTIQSGRSLKTVVRFIGLAVTATELANARLGHETDRRLFVNGNVNPNFYVVRYGGRDFSFFGPAIGLLRAIATLASNPTPEGLGDASRGLSGGVVRIIWDNITGYTFRGDPAPIGVIRGVRGTSRGSAKPRVTGDPMGYVSSPADILKYIADLAMPIAPGAAGGEVIEGVKAGIAAVRGEGDWDRAIGAGLAAGAEALGVRAAPLSRGDEAEELAKEMYGESYDNLDLSLQEEIDDLVTETMGPRAWRGTRGYLYRKKKDEQDELITGLQQAVRDHLTAPITSTQWSAWQAREKYNALRQAYRIALYGAKWDANKQRTTGGINEDLYDRDKPREEPEKGTKEHRVWLYYKIFDDARKQDGTIDWTMVDELEGDFWDNVIQTRTQGRELLNNIRSIERKYPEEMRKLTNAGRYATKYKLVIDGHESNYWALNRHPNYIKFIADEADVTASTVIEYLEMSASQREAERHEPSKAHDMSEAMSKAYAEGGELHDLQNRFINYAWYHDRDWVYAMMDSGYQFQEHEDLFNGIRAEIRKPESDLEGPTASADEYEELYLNQLVQR